MAEVFDDIIDVRSSVIAQRQKQERVSRLADRTEKKQKKHSPRSAASVLLAKQEKEILNEKGDYDQGRSVSQPYDLAPVSMAGRRRRNIKRQTASLDRAKFSTII